MGSSILAEEVMEPAPPVLVAFVKHFVRCGVLTALKEPDTAIKYLNDEKPCITRHVDDHHDNSPFFYTQSSFGAARHT